MVYHIYKMKKENKKDKRKLFSILSFIMPFANVVWMMTGVGEMFYYITNAPISFMQGTTYLFPLLGVVFGIIGLVRKENGKGYSITGIVLSSLLALFYVVAGGLA